MPVIKISRNPGAKFILQQLGGFIFLNADNNTKAFISKKNGNRT